MKQVDIEASIKNLEAMIAELRECLQEMEPERELSKGQKIGGVSPVIIRYMRQYDWGEPSNLGGITFAFVIDYDQRVAGVSFAITRDDENFCKAEGRKLAIRRLMSGDAVIFSYECGETSLVDALYSAISNVDPASLPPSVRMLGKRMFEYMD